MFILQWIGLAASSLSAQNATKKDPNVPQNEDVGSFFDDDEDEKSGQDEESDSS